MKKWNNVISYILVGVLLVSLIQLGGTETVEASQKSKAMKAYKEFLTQNEWMEGEAHFSGNYFGLKDVYGDKIPELIIVSGKNKVGERGYSIVTYNADENQAEPIYNSWVLDECYYNASKKCFVDVLGDGKSYSSKYVFKIDKDGGINYIAHLEIVNGKTDISTLNGKKASKKKVLAKINSCSKGAKLLEAPYKITKKNIKKYL